MLPCSAINAASRPQRADFPACNGFVLVPAFAIGAPAKDAAMARAWLVWRVLRPSRREEAAADPITPTTAGGWNLQINVQSQIYYKADLTPVFYFSPDSKPISQHM